MPPEYETLRITLWTLAAVGFGLIVYLARCFDQMFVRIEAAESEIEAMKLERWARDREAHGLVLAPVPHGDDDHRWN